MKSVIPFVSNNKKTSVDKWIDHLASAMPEETVKRIEDLSAEERLAADLAIVADPDPEALKTLPNLKWVQSLWAGVEKMMGQMANAPFEIVRLEDPEMARAMAEAVLAWTLYLHRNMPKYTKQQRENTWYEHDFGYAGGKHIGFVGLGNLGLEAANALMKQNFTVSGWSRSEKSIEGITTYSGDDGLTAMLGEVDIVVCLIPLTSQTRGLINAKRLAEMKQGASLINFARGPIINDDDLIAALDSGHIDHAVLDVFDVEPLPEASPFWQHPSVTVLPHISGPTNRITASKTAALNIAAYRKKGAIPKSANKARGY
ncbi:MAG: glyoxylate/hydroxypyruvate reductase A [Hyphomicrobiales bacterium]